MQSGFTQRLAMPLPVTNERRSGVVRMTRLLTLPLLQMEPSLLSPLMGDGLLQEGRLRR